jgi:hypothetical protein
MTPNFLAYVLRVDEVEDKVKRLIWTELVNITYVI